MRSLSHADVIAMATRVGDITLASVGFQWLIPDVRIADDRPCVYLWVEESVQGEREVLYIGKAGKTLTLRCRQHSQGFRKAAAGKAHAALLMERIGAGSKIGIYAIWPEPVPFRGQMIPAHSSVEDWLLGVINPATARNGRRQPH